MIVVIGGIKGGTGKTTIATNLAVIGTRLGRRVLLVDADEQTSTMDWAEQRDGLHDLLGIDPTIHSYIHFPTIFISGKYLYEQLRRFKNDFDDIYVDAGGRDTTSQRSALVVANYFLIPFKPRSFDIWTLGKVKNLVDEVQLINPKLIVKACINQGDAKGVDNDEAIKILNEEGELECHQNYLGNRKAFSNAAAQGLGVVELEKPDRKASDEIYLIYHAIHSEYYETLSGNM